MHFAAANGSAVTYTCTETGVDLISERFSDQGLIDIFLDGTLVSTVDISSPARLTQQVVSTHRGLAAGTHTLRAVKRSGTYMLADRLDTA